MWKINENLINLYVKITCMSEWKIRLTKWSILNCMMFYIVVIVKCNKK